MKQPFSGLTIAIPESRQLDILANLFIRRGADIIRCPLVSIHDSPDENSVREWLESFIRNTPDFFIILTGEGIKRLSSFAERFDLLEQWKVALKNTYLIARGPKPNRALKLLGLQADELAATPTTDGMIETLQQKLLTNKRLAIQLYGQDPNDKLQDFLRSIQANYDTVSPYIYASDAETEQVASFIQQLAENKFDLICFTSKAQYNRLEKVAKAYKLEKQLQNGLNASKIAAVGPVVADQLNEAGFEIAAMPEGQFFMKPMVRAIEGLFSS